jgi:hypothetical protein
MLPDFRYIEANLFEKANIVAKIIVELADGF